MKKEVKREEDGEIDGYLEAQLVADIKKAKHMEGRKAAPVTVKPKIVTKRTTENEEYEFLAEDDAKLPSN